MFSGINENYARELMELHTLGVNGGYTQDDVIALARILTGWGLPRATAVVAASGIASLAARICKPLERSNVPVRRLIFAGDVMRTAVDRSGLGPSHHDFSKKTFLGRRIDGGGMDEGEHGLDVLARIPPPRSML